MPNRPAPGQKFEHPVYSSGKQEEAAPPRAAELPADFPRHREERSEAIQTARDLWIASLRSH